MTTAKSNLQVVKEFLEFSANSNSYVHISSDGKSFAGIPASKIKEARAALAFLKSEMERVDLLPRYHASTGLNSFVTRLEVSIKNQRAGSCTVSAKDLNEVLFHFLRLDNEVREKAAISTVKGEA